MARTQKLEPLYPVDERTTDQVFADAILKHIHQLAAREWTRIKLAGYLNASEGLPMGRWVARMVRMAAPMLREHGWELRERHARDRVYFSFRPR